MTQLLESGQAGAFIDEKVLIAAIVGELTARFAGEEAESVIRFEGVTLARGALRRYYTHLLEPAKGALSDMRLLPQP